MTDADTQWEELLDREIAVAKLPLKKSQCVAQPQDDADADKARRGRRVSVSSLHLEVTRSLTEGLVLRHDVYDEHDELLLPARTELTKRFVQILRDRDIATVWLRPTTTPPIEHDSSIAGIPHTVPSQQLDERLAGELLITIPLSSVPGWRRPRLPIDDFKAQARRGVEHHESVSTAVSDVCDSLRVGRRIAVHELKHNLGCFVDWATVDFDLLPLVVALQHSGPEYLFDHCVNTAMLSMAIGSQLGLDRECITTLGLGGLLHDIGMLRVPLTIRMGRGELSEREWHEIYRHPLHTLDMLTSLRGVPQPVRFVAYQAHERLNGTGYPRGRSGNQLHTLAKIIAIADVYAAMTRSRPYREAMVPYVAAKSMVIDASVDKFDRDLVRTFLDTLSLFPIGSRVGLSDGSIARVMRANPRAHTAPVVEQLSADGSPIGQILDLSEDNTPTVISVA